MSEVPGDKKGNDGAAVAEEGKSGESKKGLPELLEAAVKNSADKKSVEPKKNPELDDAIGRLLSREAPTGTQEGDDSVH